jgi:hypothetical protein
MGGLVPLIIAKFTWVFHVLEQFSPKIKPISGLINIKGLKTPFWP